MTSINVGAYVETFAGELACLTDPAQMDPQPLVWPVCDRCGVAFALTLPLFVFNGPKHWVWSRQCDKPRSACKGAGVELHDAKGAVPQEGRA